MTIATAVAGLNTALDTIAGLTVHSDPPEFLTAFPCSLCYLESGEMSVVSGGLDSSLHVLNVDIVLGENDLPTVVNGAKSWPEAVLAILKADPTLGGTISHIVYPVRYQVGSLEYGVSEHYGVHFRVTIKMQ